MTAVNAHDDQTIFFNAGLCVVVVVTVIILVSRLCLQRFEQFNLHLYSSE